MRTISILTGMVALGLPASVIAQAPIGTETQPGRWEPNGWQAEIPGPGSVRPASTIGSPMAQDAFADAMPDAPPGQHRFMAPGRTVPARWRDERYAVRDWAAYGLGPPGPGMRWMRYYDDAALIDPYGRVVDVFHDVDWTARNWTPDYAGQHMRPLVPSMPLLPQPGTIQTAPGTTVTTSVVAIPAPVSPGGIYLGAPVMASTPGYVVTTTTTTTTWETVRRRGRASHSKLSRR